MRQITFGLVLVLSSLSASLQQPAGAVVVCTGPGVPTGCVVARSLSHVALLSRSGD